jgi:hypothetical protein
MKRSGTLRGTRRISRRLEGQLFAKEILDFMRERIKDYQEETNNYYNLGSDTG